MIVFSLNLLFRIWVSWRHTRPETSIFQWPCFWGGLHLDHITYISGTEGFTNALNNGLYWDLFQAIKADGNKRFPPLRQAVARHAPSVVDEDLPVIQQGDDIDVEDIPF
jgi:hypothetical protein